MSIHSGEPLQNKSKAIFGDVIALAQRLQFVQKPYTVAISSSVKSMIEKDTIGKKEQLMVLAPRDENLLESIFGILDDRWQDADFDVDDFCKALAMSKSQLYRKCIGLTGLAPNILIREYRLEKAKELMKTQNYNIAQVTFDSGFTSPSYFTKCFKKKFGILPMSYVGLLQ